MATTRKRSELDSQIDEALDGFMESMGRRLRLLFLLGVVDDAQRRQMLGDVPLPAGGLTARRRGPRAMTPRLLPGALVEPGVELDGAVVGRGERVTAVTA